jgi:hypothetical protein
MFSSRKLPTLVTASLLSLGLGAAAARAEGPAQRGQISVSGPSVRAVVAGPVAIHAYSGFSGGSVYAAPAETGTDADCKAQPLGAPTPVRADSMVELTVGAGELVCLVTTTSRPFELLWHVQKDATPAPSVMVAGAR